MKGYVRYAAFVAALCAVLSCGDGNKANTDVPGDNGTSGGTEQPATPAYKKLGTYTFGEKEYDIYSTYFSVNANEVLMFSPLRPEDRKTTFINVAVHKELDGNTLDVTSYTQNYDYFLRYESPAVLYPENIRPKSGTIFVKQVGEDEFEVHVDVVFGDGTPLKLDYNGEFAESPVS